jgi:type II secretory pathway pseudopilin PulG
MRLQTKPTNGPEPIRKRRWQAAFTFAEVLAALVFMAIVIPVAMEGMQIANRAGVVAGRKGEAVQLADSLLNELITTGDWRNSGQSGTVADKSMADKSKNMRWRLLNEPWGEDAMRLVSIEVTYQVQNQEYSVRLSTLVNE